MSQDQALERALRLLGPLEGRIMRAVWSGSVPRPFVVRDLQAVMPELAYTTLMTTANRLAEKGALTLAQLPRQKAYRYRAAGEPREFLAAQSRLQVEILVERFGDAALAAFADRLDSLPQPQRRRLRSLLEESAPT